MAVTLWKPEYHHLAFRDALIGSQSSIAFSRALAATRSLLGAIVRDQSWQAAESWIFTEQVLNFDLLVFHKYLY